MEDKNSKNLEISQKTQLFRKFSWKECRQVPRFVKKIQHFSRHFSNSFPFPTQNNKNFVFFFFQNQSHLQHVNIGPVAHFAHAFNQCFNRFLLSLVVSCVFFLFQLFYLSLLFVFFCNVYSHLEKKRLRNCLSFFLPANTFIKSITVIAMCFLYEKKN